MKNFNKQKAIVLLTAAVLLLTMTVGGTIAYLAAQTGEVVNTFTPGNVDITVDETFDGSTKTDVSIENTGNISAYIRAKVIITWQDASGNVYGTMPVAGTDYTITWGTGWDTDTNDGFYYHTTPVAAGENTSDLIENCAPVSGKAPTGYTLHVEILAQAIQAEPTSVVAEAWGVTVNGTTISK